MHNRGLTRNNCDMQMVRTPSSIAIGDSGIKIEMFTVPSSAASISTNLSGRIFSAYRSVGGATFGTIGSNFATFELF